MKLSKAAGDKSYSPGEKAVKLREYLRSQPTRSKISDMQSGDIWWILFAALAVLGLTPAASGQTPTPEDAARLPSEARRYGCPKPNIEAYSTCSRVTYKALPPGAHTLLRAMKCRVGPNYDYGSAVDLNADGQPEYLVCCEDAPHGPCAAVVIGKVGSVWKNLTAKDGVLAYAPPCGLFFVLDSRHNGFSDICLPTQCSMVSPSRANPCVPTIWHFVNGRYRSVAYTPPK